MTRLVEELTAQRAEDRIGEVVDVLVETVDDETARGRAAHQGPEVDGCDAPGRSRGPQVGDMVRAVVIESDGVDLHAEEVG